MMLIAILLQSAVPAPLTDWQPFELRRTPNGGLYDKQSAKRSGSIVTAWVRLVNVELKSVNKPEEQADAHLEVDCSSRNVARMLAYRVVARNGTVKKEILANPQQKGWSQPRINSRLFDARQALCRQVN